MATGLLGAKIVEFIGNKTLIITVLIAVELSELFCYK